MPLENVFILAWLHILTLVHYGGREYEMKVLVTPVSLHISILHLWCLKWYVYDFKVLFTSFLSLYMPQGDNYANEIYRPLNKICDTPTSLRIRTEIFTVVDDSANLIKKYSYALKCVFLLSSFDCLGNTVQALLHKFGSEWAVKYWRSYKISIREWYT
jgi:hypothetical protein